MIENWARGQQRKDIQNWVDSLRGSDGHELGFVVAQASEYRHVLLESGINLLRPSIEAELDPNLTGRLSRQIVDLQKQGRQVAAPGLMVWVHSLRAVQVAEIRYLGREMWGHLSRGFPFAHEAAFDFLQQTGVRMRLENHDIFPEGLAPLAEPQP
ncbi:MAG: hypothetical protein NXI12_01195 [Alphaproteobacteria bacterium]|nr:hypothetical protein [Alphaproteobacteria bacterium]